MQIIAVVVFLLCSAAWFLPIYKKQGLEQRPKKRKYAAAFGMGCVAFVVAFAAQLFLGGLLENIGIHGFAKELVNYIVGAGIFEEIVKFAGGWLVVRTIKPCRKIDAVLIFGMAGMGFQVCESLCLMNGVMAAIVRGVQALHILWLYWIGAFWWESRKCKANGDSAGSIRNLFIGFGVAITTHVLNDVGAAFMTKMVEDGTKGGEIGAVVILFGVFAMTVVFDIVSVRLAYRTAKASAAESIQSIADDSSSSDFAVD